MQHRECQLKKHCSIRILKGYIKEATVPPYLEMIHNQEIEEGRFLKIFLSIQKQENKTHNRLLRQEE